MDDQNKTFRTRLVSFWMLTNAGLAIAIENINGLVDDDNTSDIQNANKHLHEKQSTYFSIILYSTFGLALVRFVGVSATRNGLGSSRLTLPRSACISGSVAIFSASAVATEA
jgi:hypothetical protein